jgi:hypothetical protein
MKAILATTVLVIAAGLAVVGFSLRRPPTSAKVAAKSCPGVEGLAAELQDLRTQVARLRGPTEVRIETQPANIASAAPETKPQAEAPPEDPAERQARIEENLAQMARSLDTRFASEAVDANWSRKAEGELRTALEPVVKDTKVLGAQCASTLCRVVLSHDTLDAQRALGTTVPELAPFRGGVYYYYDPNSTPPKTTLYVTRPDLEENAQDS